ncbi:unnamed protein product, partial [marine sediment metagenome]
GSILALDGGAVCRPDPPRITSTKEKSGGVSIGWLPEAII